MLRSYSLGRCYLESGWVIHPLSGSLLKGDTADLVSFQSKKIPKIVSNALIKCENPFLLKPPSDSPLESSFVHSSTIKRNFNFFSSIKKINFYLSVLFAGLFSIKSIGPSREIFSEINSFEEDLKFNACLVKCLTVATCSSSFKKNGVLFIGAHLPLQDMHAWIIEENEQPDQFDREWINYVPLMAITYHKT